MAILNMVGGGGGGLKSTDAILRVIAPAGSTVTISKGGVSKSDGGHENASDNTLYDYYFIIHASQFDSVNAWTVTATLGGQSATGTIIIDSGDEYDVELSYIVPSIYQKVEYIQGTGTQYLITTIPVQYCTLDAKVYVTGYQEDAFILTSRTSNNVLSLADFHNSYTRVFYNGFAAYNITYGQAVTLNSLTSIQAGAKPGQQFVTVNGTRTQNTLAEYPTLAGNFSIFRSYQSSVTTYAKMRLYFLKVYDTSDTLIGDFYPVYRKSDSVAGMWDAVNQTFLTNAGTGTFLVGGDIT